MNTFQIIAVFCLVLVTISEAEITDKEKAYVHRYFVECEASLNMSLGVNIENRMEHGEQVVGDAQFKKFIFCFMTRTGFVKPDGSFNKQAFIDVLKDGYDPAATDSMVDKCYNYTIKSVEERIYQQYKCMFANHFY
ncbi:uncharacterized protein LOC120415963 [Culex pipiens pallens]|uniref:uncharacterized protein LOC120415963 n=1 Tax=Culex pipiens pallens TaxID=42434 RepID=UPI001952F68C|nr:uncharacterized protein LOC120415963 [Culex pipiens pallens]